MANNETPDDKHVRILPPDHVLQAKIGTAVLDDILTPKVVEEAQGAIHQSIDQFYAESLSLVSDLEKAGAELDASPQDKDRILPIITEKAFTIKSNAGLGGYKLASLIAKSLFRHCEKYKEIKLSERDQELIRWHIHSIKKILTEKVRGTGGALGAAVLEELKRLKVDGESLVEDRDFQDLL